MSEGKRRRIEKDEREPTSIEMGLYELIVSIEVF